MKINLNHNLLLSAGFLLALQGVSCQRYRKLPFTSLLINVCYCAQSEQISSSVKNCTLPDPDIAAGLPVLGSTSLFYFRLAVEGNNR